MFKKIILLVLILFFLNIVLAQEVVAERSGFSPIFYILILFIIVAVSSIIFFIKKLKYNLNQILKSLWISLLITLGIWILLVIIASILKVFVGTCKAGAYCPGPFVAALGYTLFIVPIIFLIVLLIYYIVKLNKNR